MICGKPSCSSPRIGPPNCPSITPSAATLFRWKSPTSCPASQTGLIDCLCLPPTIALALQVDTAAPHMLDMNWVPLVGAAIINKKTWDGLSPETQEALRQSAREAGKLIKADGRRENLESIEAMRKRGLIVHPLTPELNAEWDRTARAGLAQNPRDGGSRGHL